jgi:ribosomal protein L37E
MDWMGYSIADDGKSITCHRCGRTSYNINDVVNRYCGACKIFLCTGDGTNEE